MFNVLICEDDQAVLKITGRILTAEGYCVTEAESGSAALEELYRPEKPDLLLTDLMLPPPMSGIQLATRAKALNPDLPIIVMTGYSHGNFSPESDFLRSLVFLQKPTARTELLRAVDGLLSGPGSDRNTA